jgi:hypothetical protein
MRIHKLFLIVWVAFLLVACKRASSGIYDHVDFSFELPDQWQLMSDLWPNYQSGRDYYRLGVTEIVMVTSVKKQGQTGAFFAVASAPKPADSSLEDLFHTTYAQISEEIQDVSENPLVLSGVPGFEIYYRRPWGEPWWQFRDIWLENNEIVYVLSFHAFDLNKYQEEFGPILDSFVFK